MQLMRVPKAALNLADASAPVDVSFAEDETPKLDMVIYSGGIVTDHWFWSNLVIDLAGIKFDKPKYPILEEHELDWKIAFSNKKPLVEGNVRFDPDQVVFLDNERAVQFIGNSRKGFPYQASIGVKIQAIERIREGTSVKVNGITLKGPGTIFRQCLFKEGSVCVFGADRKTKSSTFNEEDFVECEVEMTGDTSYHFQFNEVEEKPMNLAELKAKHPELFKQIQDDATAAATAAAEAKFSQEREGLQGQVTELSGQIATLSSTVNDLQAENDKQKVLRREAKFKAAAAKIQDDLLASSKIPEHLRKHVKRISHAAFVKDEKFNEVEFTTEVKAVIEGWEKDLKASEGQTVLGGAGGGGREIEEDLDAADDDAAVDEMLTLAGEKPAE